MAAGAFGIVVTYFSCQQFLMKVTVDGQKEVAGPAIEDECEFAVGKAVRGGYYRIFFPVGPAAGTVAEVFFQSPIVLEGAEVYSAAGCASRPKRVLVPDRYVKCAMTAHAQAGNGPVAAIGGGRVVGVDIGDELFADERFVAYGRVDGAVEIPAVEAAIGADEDHPQVIRLLWELRRRSDPLGVIAGPAVKQVDDGEAALVGWVGMAGRWSNDDAADIFFHGRAVDENRVDGSGKAGRG